MASITASAALGSVSLTFGAQASLGRRAAAVQLRPRFVEHYRLAQCVAEDSSADPPAAPKPAAKPVNKPTAKAVVSKKPAYSMNKGQIVRVDKEKYLNSIEYYALDHPKFFRGIDYIYEDRGEILDLRNFEAGEYALITWAGIPTAPAWLPTSMLIKSEKLSYKRS